MAKKCYEGKVKHGSTQSIQAPYGGTRAPKGNQRITGNDLRTKKSGK